MSVTVRPYRGQVGRWECDIRFDWPDGTTFRRRLRAPKGSTEKDARRWGETRERELYAKGKAIKVASDSSPKPIPTLAEFQATVFARHEALKHKPSTVHQQGLTWKNHIIPVLGHKRLDQVTRADAQALLLARSKMGAGTLNGILSTLSGALSLAVELEIIGKAPKMPFLKLAEDERPFLDFEAYEEFVDRARSTRWLVAVLLAGEAGMRRGEVLAVKWEDIDFKRRMVKVRANTWRGIEGTTKGGRYRPVPMTERLHAALTLAHGKRRGLYVVCHDDGSPETAGRMAAAMRKLRGGSTGWHVLRHTFASHLAMRGAPPKAIQELCGHADLSETMRYMHLSPGSRDAAIRLLDSRGDEIRVGETVEKAAE